MADDEESTPWTTADAADATKREIEDYIAACLSTYDKEQIAGSELFEFWKMDFAGFEAATYKKSTTSTKALRDFLRTRNVFIPKNRLASGQQLKTAAGQPWAPLPEDQKWELLSNNQQQQQAQNSRSEPGTGSFFNANPLTALAKLYTDEQKYSGDPDEVPDLGKKYAFKVMLKGTALVQYYTIFGKQPLPPLHELRAKIENIFEGQEHKQSMLAKWNSMTLVKAISQESIKDPEMALQSLITDLRATQAKLDPELQSDKFLQAKLLTACRDHPSCQIACSIPPTSVTTLIDNLRSNVTTWKAQQTKQQQFHSSGQDSFFTDRRYFNRDSQPYDRTSSRSPYDRTPSRSSRPTWDSSRYNPRRPELSSSQIHSFQDRKACFVCHKEGCWSTKHSDQERREARIRFKETFNRRNTHNRRFITEQQLEEHIDRWILSTEGFETGDELEQMEDDFDAFFHLDQEPESFLVECGSIEPTQAYNLVHQLLCNSTAHLLTSQLEKLEQLHAQREEPEYETLYTHYRYNDRTFHGILVDTGAAGYSTAGFNQFTAFKRTFKFEISLDRSQQVNIKFGIGATLSLGKITISTPLGNLTFHVVEPSTPFLLSLNDLDEKRATLDNPNNCLIQGTKTIPASYEPCTSASVIPLQDVYTTYYPEPAMMTITTVPYSKLLAKLARNANATPDHQCASNLRDQDIDFNHSIFCDVMYIDGKPVLHVVDEATRFQAARWLQNMSSETVWEALRACWIDTYLGTPDMISHDAGTNFTSAEFNQYAQSLGISLKEVPVEAANSMGIVERYHQPLRRAFQIVSEEVRSNDRILFLQMAVKAINDTAGPDGIVPTLLVFGAYPRLTVLDGPAPSIATRAKAIKKAMSKVTKLRVQRQVATALVTRNGPVTEDIPIGSQVLVWRTHQKKWDGPFKLLAMLAETATIELPSGPTQFRSTAVKKFIPAEEDNQDAAEPIPTSPEQSL